MINVALLWLLLLSELAFIYIAIVCTYVYCSYDTLLLVQNGDITFLLLCVITMLSNTFCRDIINEEVLVIDGIVFCRDLLLKIHNYVMGICNTMTGRVIETKPCISCAMNEINPGRKVSPLWLKNVSGYGRTVTTTARDPI